MPEARHVFVTGTFDVSNYGDLLFPLIAQTRLTSAGYVVTAVSPTAVKPPFKDAAQPVSAAAMLDPDGPPASGILVGGGYILMAQAAHGMPSYEAGGVTDEAYPSLWIGATLAAALRDVPLLWNAPGAPYPFATNQLESLILPALEAADYVSVRDAASAALFRAAAASIAVVPDTVLDLPRLWPREHLLAGHAELLARKGLPTGTRSLALHVRARALRDAGTLSVAIDELALRTGLTPILLALGPELGDLAVVRELSERLSLPHTVLNDAGSLQDVAAAIAGSALYLGGSLHGYITAAAYGVPGVLVAIPAHGKFSGLLHHLRRSQDLARAWPEAIARAEAALAAGPITLPKAVAASLDLHWSTIIACLARRDEGQHARINFLRRYLRVGVERHGPSWAVQPHLSSAGKPKQVADS